MMKFRRRLYGFRHDQRGVSALEYALVAPLFFFVLFFSVEITFMLLADSSLDQAASRIARMSKLAQIPGDCREIVEKTFDDAVSFWADRKNMRVDVKIYTPGEAIAFGDEDDPNNPPVCNAGGYGDMVIFRLSFDKPGMSGLLDWFGLGLFHYERIVLIQNEP